MGIAYDVPNRRAKVLFGETLAPFQWMGIALVAAGLFFTETGFRPRRRPWTA